MPNQKDKKDIKVSTAKKRGRGGGESTKAKKKVDPTTESSEKRGSPPNKKYKFVDESNISNGSKNDTSNGNEYNEGLTVGLGDERKGKGKKKKVSDPKIEDHSSKGENTATVIKKKSRAGKEKKKKKEIKGEPVPRPDKYESLGDGPPPVPSTGKMYVGCHVSGAGGLWNAFDNRDECKAKSFALFLRNQRQWLAKPLDQATVDKWLKALKDMPPHLILPHGSYLMNLGSPVPETLEKSRSMLLEEIQRCESLGIPHYNFHPGSTLGKCSREQCCKTIAESINFVADKTVGVIFVLENMSYQGFTVGGDFHELRTIIENVKDKTRVGVCIDTCHAHAAGYDLGTEDGFQSMVEDFGKIVGWQFLRGIHVNDSKGAAGDHLDRHENIGKGTIGKKGFHRIMNFKYFQDLPIILETPWTDNSGYAEEIEILESLID